ncbi:DNA polymerase alpha subunit B [Colletes gigas]|uniref:DNA polymerase alpha subunit B n=1 Tax=Colletes gigas TaxID=935657 RepID=UPI001C9B8C20|nr:DNA polymerase alpha subunit B [Colletes gigas]
MVTEESLISCLCDLGSDVPDKSVVDRCLQLCHAYSIDTETFVELWVSHTVSHSLNISPTLEDLNDLEEEELKKNKNDIETISHSVSNIDIDVQTLQETTNNVLDIYSIEQSSQHIKRVRSPDIDTGNDNKIRAVDHTFSPPTYTPKANVPKRGLSTNVRGKVLLRFGPDIQTRKEQDEYHVSIGKASSSHVPKDVVYMYEMLSKEGAALTSNCESFGNRLCHIWNEMGPANSNVRYVRNVVTVSQVAFRTWGRVSVRIDKSTSSKMVMLEGCKRCKGDNNGPIIRLDFSGMKQYSIFPGQIIAVEGVNPTGNCLLVNKIFVKGYALLADAPKLSKDLRVYVAVGPFTTSDNLNYQPLWDLMENVAKEQPDVLILVGPFVEYTHPEIKKCTLKDTFQEFFDKLLSRILRYVQGGSTRVVLVSSNRDAHHDAVFPTPEYAIYTNKIKLNTANLYSMPDPCVINVEGLQIGVTSVDILRHLGQQEVSKTFGMDRLGRLADHVLSQATFYPLYPPFESLNFDTMLWMKYACFEQQPHIMILPSDVRYYCNTVNETLVVNPERLQKYIYAKLCIRPTSNGKWEPKNVSCEIAKV